MTGGSCRILQSSRVSGSGKRVGELASSATLCDTSDLHHDPNSTRIGSYDYGQGCSGKPKYWPVDCMEANIIGSSYQRHTIRATSEHVIGSGITILVLGIDVHTGG